MITDGITEIDLVDSAVKIPIGCHNLTPITPLGLSKHTSNTSLLGFVEPNFMFDLVDDPT